MLFFHSSHYFYVDVQLLFHTYKKNHNLATNKAHSIGLAHEISMSLVSSVGVRKLKMPFNMKQSTATLYLPNSLVSATE